MFYKEEQDFEQDFEKIESSSSPPKILTISENFSSAPPIFETCNEFVFVDPRIAFEIGKNRFQQPQQQAFPMNGPFYVPVSPHPHPHSADPFATTPNACPFISPNPYSNQIPINPVNEQFKKNYATVINPPPTLTPTKSWRQSKNTYLNINQFEVNPFEVPLNMAEKCFTDWIEKCANLPVNFSLKANLQPIFGIFIPCYLFTVGLQTNYTGQVSFVETRQTVSTINYSGVAIQNGTTSVSRSASGFHESTYYDIQSFGCVSREFLPLFSEINDWIFDKAVNCNNYMNCLSPHVDWNTSFLYQDNKKPICPIKFINDNEYEKSRSGILANTSATKCNNLQLNSRVAYFSYRLIYLPMYYRCFTFDNKKYHFFVNGQTGLATGTRPYGLSGLLNTMQVIKQAFKKDDSICWVSADELRKQDFTTYYNDLYGYIVIPASARVLGVNLVGYIQLSNYSNFESIKLVSIKRKTSPIIVGGVYELGPQTEKGFDYIGPDWVIEVQHHDARNLIQIISHSNKNGNKGNELWMKTNI
eukprot:TRINITY_DN622_c0_g3_i2.p1 TRINITY_DN622_c0_g3~~TRINITY_DN622_c0_g3_i2.p1  ORF type:complete len:545 (+),score=192.56 TRINITY_DN622_c0_g3_i2:46-1635(+)